MMKKEKQIKKSRIIVSYILIILSGILISLFTYIKQNYKDSTFEQLIYSLIYTEGTSIESLKGGLLYGLVITTIFSIIVIFPWYFKFKYKTNLRISYKNKNIDLQLFPLELKNLLYFSVFVFLLSLFFTLFNLGTFSYIKYQINTSSIFEDEYVDPSNAIINFSEDKKNLIYIYVESLETTYTSIGNGGAELKEMIPNLEQLQLNNINFSNNDKLGGAMQVYGVGWTVAGMVAQTSGVPLKLTIDGNSYSGYSSFLPGVYSLGEVLENNGYKNYIMMGSDATFAGRRDYFSSHGNYEIYDLLWARENKLIPQDYKIWWGYEDSKLFQFAKDKLNEIAYNDEPFNFTILTADTHFPDGYLDESCNDIMSNDHYSASFSCSDRMIGEFIDWASKQDFYNDTVIIISGDHLGMQTDFYSSLPEGYQRTVYNTFINSSVTSENTKNRLFSTFDMYPTTLAALGATIEGDKLGLGTNLFSNKKTVIEKYGYDYFDKELKKRSIFYDNQLLKDTHKEILTIDKSEKKD